MRTSLRLRREEATRRNRLLPNPRLPGRSRRARVRLLRRSQQMAQTEVAFSAADIAADLLAQSLRRRPANLIAKPVQEREGEGCGFGEIDWVEVEQVGFDRERVGAEGGAIADVGDGVEGLACNGKGRNVDAVSRDELRVGGKVDGRHSVFGAVSAA